MVRRQRRRSARGICQRVRADRAAMQELIEVPLEQLDARRRWRACRKSARAELPSLACATISRWENTMYRNILLCYDGTEEGRNALKEGAEVALSMNAHTHLLAILRSRGADLAAEALGAGHFPTKAAGRDADPARRRRVAQGAQPRRPGPAGVRRPGQPHRHLRAHARLRPDRGRPPPPQPAGALVERGRGSDAAGAGAVQHPGRARQRRRPSAARRSGTRTPRRSPRRPA